MDSSTKFRIARAANIENSNASNIGEDVLIIDEGGKGMYIGTNTTMPSKNIAVGPNQLKTINGESLVGTGDIEISGSDIVIFNPSGDPAEEHAKLVDAHNNGLPVYFGEMDTNGVLVPMYPAVPIIANEEPLIFLINVGIIMPYAGAAISSGMAWTVTPTDIEMSDNAQLTLSATGDGTKFLSNNGEYKTPVYILDGEENISTLRNELRNVVDKNIPCFFKFRYTYSSTVELIFAPCRVCIDNNNNEADYKVYAFIHGISGGFIIYEITITTSEFSLTNTYNFYPDNYALKSETGVAYAEYTGTSTAAEVTTKYGYFPTTLVEGTRVSVKFEGSLTYITTLNVNGTGAKNVYYKGNSLTSGMINRYNTYDFVYDGGYWRIIGVNTDSDTHYTAKNIVGASATAKSNATATNGNVYLNLIENSAVRSSHNIKGEGSVTVTSDASGNIIINGAASEASSDANVQAVDTAETIDDVNDLSNVKYVSQTLTTAQKTVARNNIGAGDVKSSDLATVATSGSYTDLLNKPTIPSAVTESTVANWGFTKNTGTYSKPYNGIPITDLDNSTQTIINNSISATQFGDLESIIQTQAFEGSLSGKLYALPDERTGDEDEVIVTTDQAVALGLPTYFEREYNSTAYIKGEGLYDEPNDTRFVLPGTELYDVGTYNDVILTINTLTKRLIESNKLQSSNTNVVLDSNRMTICECLNNNQYIVKMPTNDYSVYDISMGYIRPTYNLELSFVTGPGTIEFDFNAKWANDNPPVFESGYIYHLSFMAQGDVVNITTPVYLGVWTKYKTT